MFISDNTGPTSFTHSSAFYNQAQYLIKLESSEKANISVFSIKNNNNLNEKLWLPSTFIKSAIYLHNVKQKYFNYIDLENCISLAGTPGIAIVDEKEENQGFSIGRFLQISFAFFNNNILILRENLDFDGCALFVDSETNLLISESFFQV